MDHSAREQVRRAAECKVSDDRLIRALSVLHRKGGQSLDEHALVPSADSLLCERPLAETALLPVVHEPMLAAGAPQLVLQDHTGVVEAGRALLDLRDGHERPVGQAQALQEAHAYGQSAGSNPSTACTGGSDPAGTCSALVLEHSNSGAVDVGAPAMPADALVPSPPPALPLAPMQARAADESHTVMAKLSDEPGADSTAQAAMAATAAVPALSAVDSAPEPGRLRAADDQQGADAGAQARAAAAVASGADAADSTEAGARKAAGEGGHHSLAQLEEQNRILHELGIYNYGASDCQRLRTRVSRLSAP